MRAAVNCFRPPNNPYKCRPYLSNLTSRSTPSLKLTLPRTNKENGARVFAMGQQVSTSAEGCDPRRPSFPSLYWPTNTCEDAIYYLRDSWRFTLLWTLILYAIFHLGAAAVALFVQVGKHRSTWKYLWTVPIIYAVTAAVEAVVAGSVVGVLVGAVYFTGKFQMSTWIPFIWGWINVLMLIVSSFTIQGGL